MPFFTATGPLQEVTTPAWRALHSYNVGDLIVDSNGFIEECTQAGTSGAGQPSWNDPWGGTTTDGLLAIWTNQGSGGGWPVYVSGSSTRAAENRQREFVGACFMISSRRISLSATRMEAFTTFGVWRFTAVGPCANGAHSYPCVGAPGTTSGIATGGDGQMDCSTDLSGESGPTCMVVSNNRGFYRLRNCGFVERPGNHTILQRGQYKCEGRADKYVFERI